MWCDLGVRESKKQLWATDSVHPDPKTRVSECLARKEERFEVCFKKKQPDKQKKKNTTNYYSRTR